MPADGTLPETLIASFMSSADADGDEGQALLHNRQEAVQIDLPPSTHERLERDKAQKPLMLAYAMAAWAWRR